MQPIHFALFSGPGRAEEETILCIKSLRTFGGKLADAPFSVFYAQSHPVSDHGCRLLGELHTNLREIPLAEEVLRFPFAAKTLAAGEAENKLACKADVLVWIDRDSLFFQEPGMLLLPEDKSLGYRPVDHANIGIPYQQTLDAFWKTIFKRCNVPAEATFAMSTSVSQETIHTYVNAGMLAVRPTRGLLQSWRESFLESFQHPSLQPFYQADIRNKIFVHQAMLAAVLLRDLPREQWLELPYRVNYPLHMHQQYRPDRKVHSINELVSCRTDDFFERANWQEQITLQDPIKTWLLENVQPLLKYTLPEN